MHYAKGEIMRRTKEEMIKDANQILNDFSQKLRIVEWTMDHLVLSNGTVLKTESEIKKCSNRVSSNSNPKFIENFDIIYGLDEKSSNNCLREIKNEGCRKGGLSVQSRYGEKIKQNLNTGVPWNLGKKGQIAWHTGLTKYDHPSIMEISKAKSGKLNPMYGRKMSDEDKKYRSDLMKQKILDGEFTPNIHNSRTHWQAEYSGKKYRSSWEALFASLQFFAGFEELEYEKIRIPYTDKNGKDRVYIVDFVGEDSEKQKYIIEVKPSIHRKNSLEKEMEAIRWGNRNGYKFIIVDEDYISSLWYAINLDNFDDNTQKKILPLVDKGRKEEKFFNILGWSCRNGDFREDFWSGEIEDLCGTKPKNWTEEECNNIHNALGKIFSCSPIDISYENHDKLTRDYFQFRKESLEKNDQFTFCPNYANRYYVSNKISYYFKNKEDAVRFKLAYT